MSKSTDLMKVSHEEGSYGAKLSKFLDLPPDDYSTMNLSPEEGARLKKHLQYLSTGSASALPMICKGESKCFYGSRCPFVAEDKERLANWVDGDPPLVKLTPLNKQCLVEMNLLNEWTRYYLFEYKVDENSFSEIQMVRELAEIELMLWRLNNSLARPENAELVTDNVVGVDKQGNALYKKEISAYMQAKEKLTNRKTRLTKLMVGDRQEKYKREAALKRMDDKDASTSSAELRGQLTRLLVQADKTLKKIQKDDGTTIDIDPDVHSNDSPITPDNLIDQVLDSHHEGD